MAVALVFAMKLRDPSIMLDDDMEDFISNINPPITEDNYSEILRRSERSSSEIDDSCPTNDGDDDDDDEGEEDNGNDSDNDQTILATLSDESDVEDDSNDDNGDDELDAAIHGKARQRKKIWRNCYGESRLHLACKEKNGLKKVKQFISEGVRNIIKSIVQWFFKNYQLHLILFFQG